MKKFKCYIVNKRIDGYIAEKLGISPKTVASYRGLYDQSAEDIAKNGEKPKYLIPEEVDNLTDEQLEEAYVKLMNFRASIKNVNQSKISSNIRHIDRCFDVLRHIYSIEERASRINWISNMFSKEVDRLTEGKPISRQAVVNGFKTVDGKFYGGETSILSGVYNQILEIRQNWYEDWYRATNETNENIGKVFKEYKENYIKENGLDKLDKSYGINGEEAYNRFAPSQLPRTTDEFIAMCRHRYEEYTKIAEHWQDLVPFVLKDLVKKEGVKMGIKSEFAAVASSDSFGANDIAEKWEMSEAKRDGWMENSDLQSSLGSVGQQVRRVISTIPEVTEKPVYETVTNKDGKITRIFKGFVVVPVVDDLGNPKFRDATKTHQYMMEYLKGMQSSDDMLKRLCVTPNPNNAATVNVAKIPWMQPIVDVLLNNPHIKTQFFVDFFKNFQPYSVMFEDDKIGNSFIKFIKTRILNKPINNLLSSWNRFIGNKSKKLPTNIEIWEFPTVFNLDDLKTVNWERLAKLRQDVIAWTSEKVVKQEDDGKQPNIFDQVQTYGVSTSPLTSRDTNSVVTINGETKRADFHEKRMFLLETLSSLGIDVTLDTVDSIIFSNDIYEVRRFLENLFDPNGNSGLMYVLSDESRNSKNGINEPACFRTLCNPNASLESKKEALDKLNSKKIRFKSLCYRLTSNKDDNNKPVISHIEKLINIVNKHQEGFRIESRARYQGNTMYSFVSPSYLGDRLGAIQDFVEKNDKEGLKKFLTEEYLQSSFFVDDEYLATGGTSGKILNMWLRELVNACDVKSKTPLIDTVAKIFSFERDLGTDEKKFEDFTSKEHGIDMFIHFFADESQRKSYGGKNNKDLNRKLSAMYPVFILGDAGVSKYIRAPRITHTVRMDKDGIIVEDSKTNVPVGHVFDPVAENEVLECFYDIYMQEKRRMALDEAMALKLYANGKRVKHSKGEFSILTFLNKSSQEYNEKYDITLPDNDPGFKEHVKSKIRLYLEDASLGGIEHIEEDGRVTKIPSFKQRMENLGILDTGEIEVLDKKTNRRKKITAYKELSSVATPENIDSKVKEFFWNTKLATAQQLQLMTIDPSFYHGTKDLQKRYKEIHAPGNILDLTARDFNGNLYSPDGIERMIYFDDLTINAEQFNPEFMEVILRVFKSKGVTDKDIDAAIRNGILKPKDNIDDERNRIKKLKSLLGENYKIYSSYTANTLTDGQGYRTLTSYRRVKGMAGQWTRDMENAYNAIMAIRNAHAIRNNEGEIIDYSEATPEELRRISEYAVVFQPIKPYMFTHEKINVQYAKKVNGETVRDGSGNPVMLSTCQYIPVQHKYAEALIIPELMPKGHKLRDLGFWMDSHNIDMVGSTKIAKVGCFGQAELEYKTNDNKEYVDSEGNVIPDGKENKEFSSKAVRLEQNPEAFIGALNKSYVHRLNYRDYRIQTNVPEHINSSQLFGTQVRKLIMAGLNMSRGDEYYRKYLEGVGNFNGTVNLSTGGESNSEASLNGRNLLALYNSLICANIFDSYDVFNQNTSNIEDLSNLLQQSTIGSMREAMDNLFAYVVTGSEKSKQKFMLALFEGGIEHDAAALILSTFKKIVNKQQISGGSAVQVSAFGINGYEEDGGLKFVQDPDNNSNILYAEIEMPFDLSAYVTEKLADGTETKKPVDLSFERYCNPDGTVKPTGEAIPAKITVNGEEKTNPEWVKYQSYTYKNVDGKLVPCNSSDPEAQVYKPLIEQDYPDILSILAYRIPTERDYSMINCRIKRFSSKIAGGTLKVPPQGTTIAGFDFDIDKLYFMRREYRKHIREKYYTESNYDDSEKNIIWSNFYDNNGDIYDALKAERAASIAKGINVREEVRGWGKNKRTVLVSTRSLNDFWEDAKIEENFGVSKEDAFRSSALELDMKPTNITKTDGSIEYMESYDFTKTPENNTKTARNNLLITLIQARLMDPETVKQRYTPGGFAKSSDAARFMRELLYGKLDNLVDDNGNIDGDVLNKRLSDKNSDPEPNYDPTNPYTILIYNQQNQIAGKLIGIFANQNTNHAFASALDTFELVNEISFCGKSLKDLLHKSNPEEAAEIDLNMAEFLAASVDAVKDPVLNFLNLNTATADAGALLIRLGYTIEEVGLLFNQPIIRRICEDSFNRGVKIKTAIDDAERTLLENLTGFDINTSIPITKNSLVAGIVGNRRVLENNGTEEDFINKNALDQMAVLKLFKEIIKVSTDVSDFVLNTKFTASNAVSSTFGGMYAQQIKVNNYVDKFPGKASAKGSLSYTMSVNPDNGATGLFSTPISNNEKYLTMSKSDYLHEIRFNPFAYEQAMYDANRKALKLLSRYFPYERPVYVEARNRMQELAKVRGYNLNEEDINAIHSNMLVALLSRQYRSLFNGEAAHEVMDKQTNKSVRTNLTNREYYRERFGRDLNRLLSNNPELKELALFRFISPNSEDIDIGLNEDTGGRIYKTVWSLKLQDIGGMDADLKEEVRESWASLVEVNDDGSFKNPELANLGRDLFMYCYYQLGFDFSPLSFMHLAPIAVKDNIIVGRSNSLDIKAFDTIKYNNSDDVYVWSEDSTGANAANAFDKCGYDNSGDENELIGNSFKLPNVLTVDSVLKLVAEAKGRPELTFKISRKLTPDEFRLFTFDVCQKDIPANIQFGHDTLEDPENRALIPSISYGKDRTYRQFLDEILSGEESNMNFEDFAQMFILNHLDNPKFVLDIDRGNKALKNILLSKKLDASGRPIGLLRREGNTLRQKNGEYSKFITIDFSEISGEDASAILSMVSPVLDEKRNIEESKWCPCIKIGNSYYVACSEETKFNERSGSILSMKYAKVEPWGSSKTLAYDGNKSISPTLMYKSSMDALEDRNEEYVEPQEEEENGERNIAPYENVHIDENGKEVTEALDKIYEKITAPFGWGKFAEGVSKITSVDQVEQSLYQVAQSIVGVEFVYELKNHPTLINNLVTAIEDRNKKLLELDEENPSVQPTQPIASMSMSEAVATFKNEFKMAFDGIIDSSAVDNVLDAITSMDSATAADIMQKGEIGIQGKLRQLFKSAGAETSWLGLLSKDRKEATKIFVEYLNNISNATSIPEGSSSSTKDEPLFDYNGNELTFTGSQAEIAHQVIIAFKKSAETYGQYLDDSDWAANERSYATGSMEDLMDLVQKIRNSAKKNGVIMMDKDGDENKGC